MQERRIDVAGRGNVRLSARVFESPGGAGAPGLLLMHGLASSSHIWDLMLPRLVRRFRVVAYDARGHGLSAKPSAGYGFGSVMQDALAVARAARLRRPLVVGHSWGAMVALELAAAGPRALHGAVLIDGGLTSMRDSMTWKEAKERLAPPHLAGMPVEEFRGMIRMFFADAVDVTPDVEEIVLSVMHVGPDGRIRPHLARANHVKILRAIWEQDPAGLLARLRAPVRAIVARSADPDDPNTPAKATAVAKARRAARGRPLTVTWMDGIHDLPLQHPQTLCRVIERTGGGAVR